MERRNERFKLRIRNWNQCNWGNFALKRVNGPFRVSCENIRTQMGLAVFSDAKHALLLVLVLVLLLVFRLTIAGINQTGLSFFATFCLSINIKYD